MNQPDKSLRDALEKIKSYARDCEEYEWEETLQFIEDEAHRALAHLETLPPPGPVGELVAGDLHASARKAWDAAKYNDEEQGYVEMQFQSFWSRFETTLKAALAGGWREFKDFNQIEENTPYEVTDGKHHWFAKKEWFEEETGGGWLFQPCLRDGKDDWSEDEPIFNSDGQNSITHFRPIDPLPEPPQPESGG